MADFKIKIKGLAELQKLQNAIGNAVTSAEEVVNYGYDIAYKLAPKATDKLGGGTKKAITKVIYDKETKASLVLKQPQIRAPLIEYHLWMHGLGKYDISEYIKTGKAKFMFITAEKMQDYIIDDIKNNLNKASKL